MSQKLGDKFQLDEERHRRRMLCRVPVLRCQEMGIRTQEYHRLLDRAQANYDAAVRAKVCLPMRSNRIANLRISLIRLPKLLHL